MKRVVALYLLALVVLVSGLFLKQEQMKGWVVISLLMVCFWGLVLVFSQRRP